MLQLIQSVRTQYSIDALKLHKQVTFTACNEPLHVINMETFCRLNKWWFLKSTTCHLKGLGRCGPTWDKYYLLSFYCCLAIAAYWGDNEKSLGMASYLGQCIWCCSWSSSRNYSHVCYRQLIANIISTQTSIWQHYMISWTLFYNQDELLEKYLNTNIIFNF